MELNIKGHKVLIDDEDYDLIKGYSWCIKSQIRNGVPQYYAFAYIKNNNHKNSRSTTYMHRFIMDAPKGIQVDHIFHNTLDNRKSKLRLITPNGNNRNCIRKNETGFKGVRKAKFGNFQARICINRKEKHLGMFDTAIEAHEAYMSAYNEQIKKEVI